VLRGPAGEGGGGMVEVGWVEKTAVTVTVTVTTTATMKESVKARATVTATRAMWAVRATRATRARAVGETELAMMTA